jgi:hypothetical protein
VCTEHRAVFDATAGGHKTRDAFRTHVADVDRLLALQERSIRFDANDSIVVCPLTTDPTLAPISDFLFGPAHGVDCVCHAGCRSAPSC